ncbi:MAG TPA: porin family protein [Caulobacteraceae bacterium]|nr:porin family protein [Caulobacteraceae bacterium]
MKFLMMATSAAALALGATAAQAQVGEGGMYGSLGYAATDRDDANLSAIQGRFGVKLHPMFGIEGEAAFGIDDEDIGAGSTVKLDRQIAAYGVGFLPLGERFELLGRVGYGNTQINLDTPLGEADDDANSWNLGVGGQFHFTPSDAIRADWTRHNFDEEEGAEDADLDVWSVSYVRRF